MITLKSLIGQRFTRSVGFSIPATLFLLATGAAPAGAASCPEGSGYKDCAPGWEVASRLYPTNLTPGSRGVVGISVFNVGAGNSEGTVTVTDVLPKGLTAVEAGDGNVLNEKIEEDLWDCTGNGPGGFPGVTGATVVQCTNDPVKQPFIPGGGGISGPEAFSNIGPDDSEIAIAVDAASDAVGADLPNQVAVSGGGASDAASTVDPVTFSSTPAGFGFAGWDGWFSNADGTPDTQAGSHPYEATLRFDLNAALGQGGGLESTAPAGGEIRNLEVELPPGFVGDPTAAPQCTREQFDVLECPAASLIGLATIGLEGNQTFQENVYNIVPPAGQPAEFAFSIIGVKTLLDTGVRTGGDDGLTTHVHNIAQRNILRTAVTLWGVPADQTHSPFSQKGRTKYNKSCLEPGRCPRATGALKPLLTLPTSCAGPQKFTIRADTWQHPETWAEASFESHDSNGNPTGFTGCERLDFDPNVTLAPDTTYADTPAGLTVNVKPPVGGLQEPEGLSTSDIQNTKVVLPQGLVINPGQAAGLQACPEGPASAEPGNERYGDNLPLTGEDGNEPRFEGASNCPNASKIGTVTIESPLIEGAAEKQFEGNVYLLQSNPPELKLLVAASADGVNLKLVGVVHLNEQTGQLTTTFSGTPELPFTDFKLSFSGGAQAALDTPTQCGVYAGTADFNPWSNAPGSSANFISNFLTENSFAISSGPGGNPCPSSPLPFSPSLTAGASTDQAGGFTNFSMLLQRGDGQQRIEKLSFKTPAGLSGMLSTVPLCDEADSNAGTCPAASHIGHASVSSGPGPYPLVLPQPGDPELPIYLTGPYHGAPFGLSIVTPVLAGPFNLGTIVTRAKIEVDDSTAQITVTTDPLPQVVKGVPTDLRSIDAVIDRPNFMFNPTNCNPSSFSGTATSTPVPGTSAPATTVPISSPFGVGSCRQLEFAPKFSVSTSGKTSKADGASLTAKVSYPIAAQGTQSDIGLVKVELPKQLPSRLTTLQKACLAKVFEANPASCPKESFIGTATVHTPVLPVPLTGPVIFVSHGGEAFPSLTVVLQGDNVTLDLVGATFISKAGITSTTFKTVPDAPFSTFELTLPEGPYSALGTNYALCTQNLQIPNEFVGQNGAVLHQSTHIEVEGCSKSLSVVSTKVDKKTLTLSVYAPAAGKVTTSAKGLSAGVKTYSGNEALTFTLKQNKSGKLKTKIKLSFTPKSGKHQTKTLKVSFKK
jgi:hypothetical protein